MMQIFLVDRYDLRHIRNRVLWQTALIGRKEYISRGIRKVQIRADDQSENSADSAAVK
jgi:hypothetical protein